MWAFWLPITPPKPVTLSLMERSHRWPKTEHNLIFEFHAWPFLVGFCCVQWCSGVILVYSFGRLFIGIRSRKAPSLNEQVTESPLISPIKAPSHHWGAPLSKSVYAGHFFNTSPYHIQHGNSINNMVKSFGFTWYRSAGTSVSYSLRSPSEQNKQQTHFRNVLDAYIGRNVSLLIWVGGHGLSFHTDLHSSHFQSQWDSSVFLLPDWISETALPDIRATSQFKPCFAQ